MSGRQGAGDPYSDNPSDTGGGSSDSTLWSDIVDVPDVLEDLGSEAKSLLKDPKTYIVAVIIEWLVGGILDFVESVIALVLEAFMLVAGIPGTVGGAFGTAGAIISSTVFGVFGTVTEMGVGLVEGLGWTAPLVVAIVFFLLLEAGEEFGPPAFHALSDLLGAIPVVGSILDAIVTFLIGLTFGGDGS